MQWLRKSSYPIHLHTLFFGLQSQSVYPRICHVYRITHIIFFVRCTRMWNVCFAYVPFLVCFGIHDIKTTKKHAKCMYTTRIVLNTATDIYVRFNTSDFLLFCCCYVVLLSTGKVYYPVCNVQYLSAVYVSVTYIQTGHDTCITLSAVTCICVYKNVYTIYILPYMVERKLYTYV